MNNHVIVIGGSKGIGKETVKHFLNQNYYVTAISRDQDHLEPATNLNHILIDVTQTTELIKIIGQIEKPHSLVFCQRYRGKENYWQGEIETSLTATKNIIEALTPSVSIVIVSSILGSMIAEDTELSYHVCKAGLIQLTKYYAIKLASKGIRVNCISPGTVLKPESQDFYLNNKNIKKMYDSISPLGRMGHAKEMAQIIYFLCSDNAKIITGQNIVSDGGLSLQWQETLSKKLTQ